MQREYGARAVADVPTGVDTDYFRPGTMSGDEPHGLVFTGSMDWLPNEDAIRYFTDDILPRIKQRVPDVTLTVVGRNPYPSLLELGRRDPSVVVTGRVDDVRPVHGACRPLRGADTHRRGHAVEDLRGDGYGEADRVDDRGHRRASTSGRRGCPARRHTGSVRRCGRARPHRRAVRSGARPRAAATVRENFGWSRVSASFAELCEHAIRARVSGHGGAQYAAGVRAAT